MSANAEVFESPDPEVSFQAYAAVDAGSRANPGNGSRAGGVADDPHAMDESNGELDEGSVAPTQAFEVFMGKVYRPTEFEAMTTRKPPEKTGAEPNTESVLQRFLRLQMETKELEADLALLASHGQDPDNCVMEDAAQQAEMRDITQGLATLRLNLASLGEDPANRPFLQETGGELSPAAMDVQRDLTSKLFQQIDAIKRMQQGRTAPSASSGDAPIVYEIYSNGELQAVDREAKTRMVALEARITQLEQAIGTRGVQAEPLQSQVANTDLASAVSDLEQRVGLLNEKNLDAIKTRTTALVHELTLLHKLQESPSVQNALNAQADRDKIQHIYEQLQSVDAAAASVPTLVDRLVTLKGIHDDSLDMSTRVQKIEQSQAAMDELMQTDVEQLEHMETSLQENAKLFQSNLQLLDERISRLLGST